MNLHSSDDRLRLLGREPNALDIEPGKWFYGARPFYQAPFARPTGHMLEERTADARKVGRAPADNHDRHLEKLMEPVDIDYVEPSESNTLEKDRLVVTTKSRGKNKFRDYAGPVRAILAHLARQHSLQPLRGENSANYEYIAAMPGRERRVVKAYDMRNGHRIRGLSGDDRYSAPTIHNDLMGPKR